MHIQTAENLYNKKAKNEFDAPTRAEFVKKAVAARKKPTVSVEYINSQLPKFNAWLKEHEPTAPLLAPLKVPTAAERKHRRELSIRARQLMFERISYKRYNSSQTPPTNERYPEDLMMTPKLDEVPGRPDLAEVRARNAEIERNNQVIARVINAPETPENRKEVIRLHYKMLKKLDELHAEELLSREISDEELVDRFNDIHCISSTMLQFQNIRSYFKNHNIQPVDEESREQLESCEKLMKKYEVFQTMGGALAKRFGAIENPHYEEFEMNTPEFSRFCAYGLAFFNRPLSTIEEGNDVESHNAFSDFWDLHYQYMDYQMDADILTAVELLQEKGCKEENLVYRSEGKPEIVPLGNRVEFTNTFYTMTEGSYEIFDKTDPTKKVTLTTNTDAFLTRCRAAELADKGPVALPTEPKKVDPPQMPVPTGWQKLLYTVTFHNAYSDVCDEQERQQKFDEDTARYQNYQEEMKRYRLKVQAAEEQNSAYEKRRLERVKAKEQERKLAEEQAKAAKEREKRREAMESSENAIRELDNGIRTIRDIYGAQPQFREELSQGGNAAYKKEQFDKLASYDLGLAPSTNQAPGKDENGRINLTEDDFCVLAMTAACRPEIGGKTKNVKDYERDIDPDILVESRATMFTADMGNTSNGQAKPRASIGGFFEDVMQPAREAAKDAIEAYRKGDSTALASLVAEGIALYDRQYKYFDQKSSGMRAMTHFFGRLPKIMEADPALAEQVRAKCSEMRQTYQQKLEDSVMEQQKLMTDHPDYFEMRTNHVAMSGADSKEERNRAKAAFKEAWKAHPDYPETLMKEASCQAKQISCQNRLHFDLDKAITAIKGNQRFSALTQRELEARAVFDRAQYTGESITPEQRKEKLPDILRADVLRFITTKHNDKNDEYHLNYVVNNPICQALGAALEPGKKQDKMTKEDLFVQKKMNGYATVLFEQVRSFHATQSQITSTFGKEGLKYLDQVVHAMIPQEQMQEMLTMSDKDLQKKLSNPSGYMSAGLENVKKWASNKQKQDENQTTLNDPKKVTEQKKLDNSKELTMQS